MADEKPNGNKIIIAIALFFVLGFAINLFLNYNQTSSIQERAPVGDEILTLSRQIDKVTAENKKMLEDISNRLKVLEDNSKKAK